MLHHVALEVAPHLMAREGDFWLAVGFESVAAPDSLGEGFRWYERDGTQIHLMETIDPSVPPVRGHTAVLAPDIDEAVQRLERAGFEVVEGRRHWGARRVKTETPAGHVVEIMGGPPATAGENG